jgi:hypothetical protein
MMTVTSPRIVSPLRLGPARRRFMSSRAFRQMQTAHDLTNHDES